MDKDYGNQYQSYEAYDVLGLVGVGSACLIVSVAERALDMRSWDIGLFLLASVHFPELSFKFVFLFVVIDRLVVEDPVLLLAEEIENTHKRFVLIK